MQIQSLHRHWGQVASSSFIHQNVLICFLIHLLNSNMRFRTMFNLTLLLTGCLINYNSRGQGWSWGPGPVYKILLKNLTLKNPILTVDYVHLFKALFEKNTFKYIFKTSGSTPLNLQFYSTIILRKKHKLHVSI